MIIERFSKYLANKIREINIDEIKNINEMTYAISILINGLLTIFICMIYGFIFGNLEKIFLSLIAFVIIRFFSGGRHIKSMMLCSIVSASIFILVACIEISHNVRVTIDILSLIIIVLFSPYNFKNTTTIKEENYIYFKAISIVLVIICLYINNSVIALTVFIQAITLIHNKRGEKYEKRS